ncbi:SNARE-interacting protein KEULE-like isoform X2 [Rutidosis leptorrhynchoides]|uniref:SNARE-interacting protein KEULE-like isoform X2 n=1 Tax=Rutidosis leptorrhynchoides TaxID=125765 RepID=UPI003A9996E8
MNNHILKMFEFRTSLIGILEDISHLVLIMDKVTIKIMSCSCKMADITDEGVSLVEDINKRRQPLPTMDAVYYIQPTREKNMMVFCPHCSIVDTS